MMSSVLSQDLLVTSNATRSIGMRFPLLPGLPAVVRCTIAGTAYLIGFKTGGNTPVGGTGLFPAMTWQSSVVCRHLQWYLQC
jgi:hypothetical protein